MSWKEVCWNRERSNPQIDLGVYWEYILGVCCQYYWEGSIREVIHILNREYIGIILSVLLREFNKRSAPQIDSGSTKNSATATKQQMEELKILRDALVANFRWDLPRIMLYSNLASETFQGGFSLLIYLINFSLNCLYFGFIVREQMKLRHRLMEIDNHILGLTMEFERQNMIVTQWEMDKAK